MYAPHAKHADINFSLDATGATSSQAARVTGRPSAGPLEQSSLEAQVQLASAAAPPLPGAAAPLRADTAASLDIHSWAHSHNEMTTPHPGPATLAVAHLAA